MRGFSLRTPGRGGGRKGTGRSGRSVTGPLPAPRRAEELGPRTPQLLYRGAAPHQRYQYATGISRINQEAVLGSCRLMPFGRVAASVTPCGRRGRPQRVKSLRSKVDYHLVAIPPHLCRGEPRQKCSGRPGCSRPGCWRSVCQDKPATPCAVGTVSARPSAIGDILRGDLAMGRPGPGPGGRLPNPSAACLCRGLGASGLPALVPSKPVSPPAPDRLQDQRSTAFRALGHLETQTPAPASMPATIPTTSPAPPPGL